MTYVCSEGVEQCIPWAENTTQQIDLAFNIFFMVYFFIRVGKDAENQCCWSGSEFLLSRLRIHKKNQNFSCSTSSLGQGGMRFMMSDPKLLEPDPKPIKMCCRIFVI